MTMSWIEAVRLLHERAAALTAAELDWPPPAGGSPLRRVLHHVARSEILYAAAVDEALPDDPGARYAEADARFVKRLAGALDVVGDPSLVFPDPYGTFRTPAEAVALEDALMTRAA